MTPEELKNELHRCLGCKVKPCEKACPLGVSPHDFIALAKGGDFKSAAAEIAKRNPLAQTCGLVCPDRFCQSACIRKRIDTALEIPCLQARIMEKGGLPDLELPASNDKHACVVGGGPAGLGALYEFLLNGWNVDIYEKDNKLGGAARLIPPYRLPPEVLEKEINRLITNERVNVYLNQEISDYESMRRQYDALVLALGEPKRRTLGILGEEESLDYRRYLSSPAIYSYERVAVVGGGEVALDCAITLKKQGSKEVEMFVRRRQEDMRIMAKDFAELEQHKVTIRALSSVTEIRPCDTHYDLTVINNRINEQGKAEAIQDSTYNLTGYDKVIMALGSYFPKEDLPQDIPYAGDMSGNCGTIVEAIASGRAAAKQQIRHQEQATKNLNQASEA